MSDYEELIKNLRSVKDTWQTQEEEWMLQAADAIEKLMALTAVPQEMSAREFANEFRRMCDAYLNCMEDGDDCPLFTANICSLDELVNIVPVVEQWAAEHPEERSEE